MYKLYSTGQEFLDENINVIRNDPLGAIFFEANAKMIPQCDDSNYALRVEEDGEVLIAIRVNGYPLVLYGSERCVSELAHVVANNKLKFAKVIGYYDLLNAFLTSYEQLVGGRHKVNLSMDIMYCEKVNPCDTSGVEQATAKDSCEIAQLVIDFGVEAGVDIPERDKMIDKVSRDIATYALIRVGDEIVSIGHCRADSRTCRISNVYTKPEHRNKGYSRKVVTYLTQQAIKSGNLPCLHVDQHNPVSNHLYQSIGYVYGKSRYEIEYIPLK